MTEAEFLKILEIASILTKDDHLGSKRVTSRDQYQWIDLTEYYNNYNRHNELERDRQTLEGAKINFRSTIFKRIFMTYYELLKRKKACFKPIASIINGIITIEH
jgi:hypothetical protein